MGKKIILTESQVKRLKNRLVENVDSKYSKDVKVVFSYYNITLKGREINDIPPINIRLSYDIYVEYKSWGINGISLFNVKGPEEVEIEVNYFIDNDNTDDVTVPIKFKWDTYTPEIEKDMGIISIGDEVEVILANGVSGGLVVKEVIIPTYSL
jgi:hypothetical protein